MSPTGSRRSGRTDADGRPGVVAETDLNTLPGAVGALLAGTAVLYAVATFIQQLFPLIGSLLSLATLGVAVAWLGDRL